MEKRKKKILVIGDIMLDRYIICDHVSQSPEADIPLLKQIRIEDRLGGAGNVCHNLITLGMDTNLISICGDDSDREKLAILLDQLNIKHELILDVGRPTTLKTRTVDSNFKQFYRLDRESCDYISEERESEVINAIDKAMGSNSIDGVIIQDYNKGLITERIIRHIQATTQDSNIPLYVDPKNKHFELLSNCDYFKPNIKELSLWSGHSISPSQVSISKVIIGSELDSAKNIFITLAEKGIYYRTNKGSEGIIPGQRIDDPDVSGAGDTVLAAIVAASLKGLNINKIAQYANDCGAEVCKKRGVSPFL